MYRSKLQLYNKYIEDLSAPGLSVKETPEELENESLYFINYGLYKKKDVIDSVYEDLIW